MDFIRRTIDLANANVDQGRRPFACVIVKDGEILAEAADQVVQTHDPTAYAEICAIREALGPTLHADDLPTASGWDQGQ